MLRWILPVVVMCSLLRPAWGEDLWSIPKGAAQYRNVAYVDEKAAPRQKLDIIVPPHAKGTKLPVIVWVHGGAWLAGDKTNNAAQIFLARGFIAVSVNYRLSQDAVWPAQMIDCRSAIRYLRKNADKYDIDDSKIIAWGGSAGGHLVAMLGTTSQTHFAEDEPMKDTSCAVAGVIDWFGPTNLVQLDGDLNGVNPVAKLIGGPVQKNLDKTRAASPISYVTGQAAPVLIIHGDHDPLVPLDQSQQLLALYEKAGVKSRLVTLKNAGHGGGMFFDREPVQTMFDFVDDVLKSIDLPGKPG